MSFNQLTPAEVERLAKLTEECGEISQMVGKVLVHGWGSFHPRYPEEGSNREKLEKEIGGLGCVIHLMIEHGDLSFDNIERAEHAKLETISRYLHEQPTLYDATTGAPRQLRISPAPAKTDYAHIAELRPRAEREL